MAWNGAAGNIFPGLPSRLPADVLWSRCLLSGEESSIQPIAPSPAAMEDPAMAAAAAAAPPVESIDNRPGPAQGSLRTNSRPMVNGQNHTFVPRVYTLVMFWSLRADSALNRHPP
jgi:hypothetical protein